MCPHFSCSFFTFLFCNLTNCPTFITNKHTSNIFEHFTVLRMTFTDNFFFSVGAEVWAEMVLE